MLLGVLQGAAVAHVCERVLQHLVDSGILTLGWRHWPPTWMQEGGACAECLGSRALNARPSYQWQLAASCPGSPLAFATAAMYSNWESLSLVYCLRLQPLFGPRQHPLQGMPQLHTPSCSSLAVLTSLHPAFLPCVGPAAAPDVLRFLLLTHALSLQPGWVERMAVLSIRGVPPSARQTVSSPAA